MLASKQVLQELAFTLKETSEKYVKNLVEILNLD